MLDRRNIMADGAAWLLASVVAVCVALLAVWWGGVNQDEGWYLYAARLVGEGKNKVAQTCLKLVGIPRYHRLILPPF